MGGRLLDHADVRLNVAPDTFRAEVVPDGATLTGRWGAAAGRWIALVVVRDRARGRRPGHWLSPVLERLPVDWHGEAPRKARSERHDPPKLGLAKVHRVTAAGMNARRSSNHSARPAATGCPARTGFARHAPRADQSRTVCAFPSASVRKPWWTMATSASRTPAIPSTGGGPRDRRRQRKGSARQDRRHSSTPPMDSSASRRTAIAAPKPELGPRSSTRVTTPVPRTRVGGDVAEAPVVVGVATVEKTKPTSACSSSGRLIPPPSRAGRRSHRP